MERTSIFAAAFVGLCVTMVLGYWMIPWLKKIKYGQTINDIGPTWHKYKEGTPTMGGLMFITGTFCAIVVGYVSMVLEAPQFLSTQYAAENFRLISSFFIAIAFSLIGFLDDFEKISHKQNLGLTPWQKIVLQVVVAAVYTFLMNRYGECDTTLMIPFVGRFDFGWFYYPLMIFSIVGIVNSVNLTDGLDGLATSATFVVTLGFLVISAYLGYAGTTLFSTALAASLIGFLFWNFKPARVFMGDTGSMFLGGAVVAMSFGVSMQLLMLLSGIVYVCEAASDIIQFAYFRATHGKRIFKMAPIHHHFEMCGWSEEKIILVFCIVALIGTGLSVLSAVTA